MAPGSSLSQPRDPVLALFCGQSFQNSSPAVSIIRFGSTNVLRKTAGDRTAVPKQRNESQNRHSNPSLHFAPVLPLVPERHSAHPRRSQQIWSISYRRYETNPRFSSRYTGRECENEINQATLPACCYPIYAPNQVVFRARSRLILIDSLTPFVPVGL
jgi:hypothetical protein